MTEEQWITATDPQSMLEFLQSGGKASERKLRLFGVACVSRIVQMVTTHPTHRRLVQEAVTVAERFADGIASGEELDRSRSGVVGLLPEMGWVEWSGQAVQAAIPLSNRPFLDPYPQ